MKQAIKLGLLASALMAITGTVSAQVKDITVVDTKESPYVIDARGVIVRDPFGLCWRTGSWSVDRAAKTVIKDAKYPNWTAICECEDKSLWVKPVCEPPPARSGVTQAFFERFLRNKTLRNLAPEKGRLRNYLLTVLKRFLRDQHDRAVAAKRGGGVPVIPLDTAEAEAQVQVVFSANSSPDLAFDRAWAETVLQGGVERLRAQYETEGRAALFAKLSPYLTRPVDKSGYAGSVEPLNMDANTVAAEVFRLRRRYRELVRAEVANTVATPAEIDSEMGYLVELLAK